VFLKSYGRSCRTGERPILGYWSDFSLSRLLTGLNRTMSHQTMACPAIVRDVRTSPLVAKRGTKYVRIEAVGILAAFLGTCEFLLRTVGRVNMTSPALPIEIKRSTRLV
jgi:hypothetical protein